MRRIVYTPPSTVAFEDVPIGSGGSAVPKLTRSSSRQCLACDHKAKLHPEPPSTAPPVLLPSPIPEHLETGPPDSEPVVTPPAPSPRLVEMTPAKAESVRETLEDRDPNNLNKHLQIVWDDVIGEPEGARSPECAWRLSNGCFQHARNWCYTLLAVVIAPPCALLMGCGFACLAFEQIWCTAPCLRCVKIYFASIRTIVQSCMAAVIVPTAEALGHMCRHIRVNMQHDAPEEKDLLVV